MNGGIVKESKNLFRKCVECVHRRKENDLSLQKEANEMNIEITFMESHNAKSYDEYSRMKLKTLGKI